MKRKIAAIIAALIVLFGTVNTFAMERIEMEKPVITNSNMAVLYEESTDTWMFQKNETVTNAPASMTKIMTATLVLDFDPELSGTTTVSPMAVSNKYCYWMDDVHLEAGEECTVNDLMHYLLIASGNEAATTLAEYVAGDIDTFIDMMNARAKEIGMERTHYFDPHGLSNDSRTTCSDMIKLCRFAVDNYPKLVEITSTQTGSMPVSNKRTTPLRYSTTNRVMNPGTNIHYDTGFSQDIIGIKTGSTTAAGLNLSCCMVHDDLKFFSVVMHAKSAVDENRVEYSGHHADTASLMKWARSFKKVGVEEGAVVANTMDNEKNSLGVDAVAASSVYILAQDDVEPSIELYQLGRKVSKGDIVGKVTYADEFGNVRSTDLLAAEDCSIPILPVICMTAIVAILTFTITRRKLAKQHRNL